MNIHNFGHLLEHFPYRHVDKTRIDPIRSINPGTDTIQVKGTLLLMEETGTGRGRRLTARLGDGTGQIDLIWFQGVAGVMRMLQIGRTYLAYVKVSWFRGEPQLSHPELDEAPAHEPGAKGLLEPVYPSTEKLKQRFLGGRALGKLVANLLP
ncbi:MAG TPA: ATP-dependent DNA helicase RecG, partial [Phnomibacter sp.]|nr:ATP-dependent DNA helicase RecG [Phnomibacter sp.]